MKRMAAILAAAIAAWPPSAAVAGIYYEVVTETAFEQGSATGGTRVTGLQERDIDDAVFDIPSGFSPDESPGLDNLMRLYDGQ